MNPNQLSEELRETLEQIAALCPLHSVFDHPDAGGNGEGGRSFSPCRLSDFELKDDEQTPGVYFSCRHSKQGICAGHIPQPEPAPAEP